MVGDAEIPLKRHSSFVGVSVVGDTVIPLIRSTWVDVLMVFAEAVAEIPLKHHSPQIDVSMVVAAHVAEIPLNHSLRFGISIVVAYDVPAVVLLNHHSSRTWIGVSIDVAEDFLVIP